MMAAFGPVSGGHFNPAVSVAMPLKLRKMVDFMGIACGNHGDLLRMDIYSGNL